MEYVEGPVPYGMLLPVPVGPTREVEFEIGNGADWDSVEVVAPPDTLDEEVGAVDWPELYGKVTVPVGPTKEVEFEGVG